jgi:Na+-transporting NADH:ubiquinone oxidoreductase subunit B
LFSIDFPEPDPVIMKLLNSLFKKLAPKFTKGGSLEWWKPLFETAESLVFISTRTTRTAPHIRDAVDYQRIMITVIIALVPCVIMALWNTGFQANSGLQQLGIALPAGWRGTVMAWFGCDPASHLANMVHGALYFLPIYLVTVAVGRCGNACSIWSGVMKYPRPSW